MEHEANLFEMWGGLRQMARDLQRPASTIHRWKSAGRIPATEQAEVLAAALKKGLDINTDNIVFPLGRSFTSDAKSGPASGRCIDGKRSHLTASQARPA